MNVVVLKSIVEWDINGSLIEAALVRYHEVILNRERIVR